MLNRNTTLYTLLGLTSVGLAATAGCERGDQDAEAIGVAQSEITDVAHTDVERQSIGNCWIYSMATWVESMNLSYIQANPGGGGSEPPADMCVHNVCEVGAANTPFERGCNQCATKICEADAYCCDNDWDDVCADAVADVCGASACEFPNGQGDGGGDTPAAEPLDISQSYWTYWHWFDQVTGFMSGDEIQTGGNQWKSNAIARDRGLMLEKDFVPEDTQNEMSDRQQTALNKVNAALKNGELSTREARRDGKLVRKVFDEAWGLSDEVIAQLDQVFGEDGEVTLRRGSSVDGTNIIDSTTVDVRYTRYNGERAEVVETNLVQAISDWQVVRYPRDSAGRRKFQQRVQRALHDRQPVIVTWDVDFNAMENGQNERRGSFNMTTLTDAGGAGRQGGHMVVAEDYQIRTADYGVLEAGTTLDPQNLEDQQKLDAALRDDSEMLFIRIKNSWGAARPDRAFAPGFAGYHDLAMDYMNGPIAWCPSREAGEDCNGQSTPWRDSMLPPGY